MCCGECTHLLKPAAWALRTSFLMLRGYRLRKSSRAHLQRLLLPDQQRGGACRSSSFGGNIMQIAACPAGMHKALDAHVGLLWEMALSPSAGPPCRLPPSVRCPKYAAPNYGCAPTEGQLPLLYEQMLSDVL